MKKLKIIDLFCGTGGFSKGFENSKGNQFETVFGIDLLPTCIKTFKANHPGAESISGDIRAVRPSDVQSLIGLKRGEVDLIIGGPPCQGFSSIRPFRSTNDDDPRNTLFEEFALFVNWFRPKALVLENVVGLATHAEGQTISTMEKCFEELGYQCDWKILNAAHFGIPQKRERLIFIGVKKGAPLTFPAPTHECRSDTIGHKNKSRLLLPEESNLFQTVDLQPALTVLDAIADLPAIGNGEAATRYSTEPSNAFQRERRKRTSILTLHESTKHSEKMMEIIKHSGPNISYIPKHLISSGFSTCYSRLPGNEPSSTITVNFVHPASNRCIHPKLDRALTPREGARLQSFDDDFVFAGNRSQITKQIGNAVPPLLGKAIAEALLPIF